MGIWNRQSQNSPQTQQVRGSWNRKSQNFPQTRQVRGSWNRQSSQSSPQKQQVRGVQEYDGLTTLIAAVASRPGFLQIWFEADECPTTGALIIGRNENLPGVKDVHKVRELLHDLLLTAFR